LAFDSLLFRLRLINGNLATLSCVLSLNLRILHIGLRTYTAIHFSGDCFNLVFKSNHDLYKCLAFLSIKVRAIEVFESETSELF